MQSTSLFVIVAVASFSLNASMPLADPRLTGPDSVQGLLRYIREGDSYLNNVPPCLDNVHKSKLFEYYSQYSSSHE